MRNLCMTVSYDGTAYAGFQTQPGLRTIQGEIEAAIAVLTGEIVKITASGRTDAGVHARGQVFNFYTESRIPAQRWAVALNTRLPSDIVIHEAMEVPMEFHSRRAAKQKTYRYSIHTGRIPNLFDRWQQFHHPTKLNVSAMETALAELIGTYDFTSFCSRRTDKEVKVRTVCNAWIEQEFSLSSKVYKLGETDECAEQPDVLHIFVTGNGFLYNMVRIIVGTLLQIGEGKRPIESMRSILLAKDRALAGPTAMAHGLMLWEVRYEL